jgi:hypothetical protein
MRLPRPHVPLSVQCAVAIQQLHLSPVERIAILRRFERNYGHLKKTLLIALAPYIGEDPQLDHDPPLGARQQIRKNGKFVRYVPDANDPNHLVWRAKEAHRVKTLVRGEHGQYSDLALIKRERRRNRPRKKGPKIPSAKRPWPKRKFPKREKRR